MCDYEPYSPNDDTIDGMIYCTGVLLDVKTVGKNLLDTSIKKSEPVMFIQENGNVTLNTGDFKTYITPNSLFTYKDDKCILKIENNEKEESDNMNKVLDLYVERERGRILNQFEKIVDEEYEELELVKEYNHLITSFETQLEELVLADDSVFEPICTDNVYKYQVNEDMIKHSIRAKYQNDISKEMDELDNMIAEVEAQLSLSDDLEYQLDVLKRYDIIDKKTGKVKSGK